MAILGLAKLGVSRLYLLRKSTKLVLLVWVAQVYIGSYSNFALVFRLGSCWGKNQCYYSRLHESWRAKSFKDGPADFAALLG